ncbi:MAG: dihydroneopterin aldolase, partial [Pseudomonadota bacterium]
MDRAATPAPVGVALPRDIEERDTIFLTDYVREMEIGVYASERGVTQRVSFDITVEVARSPALRDDRVQHVISYDEIVQAIETVATGPRIQLLETFAECLAEMLLTDPRARRVHLRIAKLDRLPNGGRLGVEITRSRHPDANERVWALSPEIR